MATEITDNRIHAAILAALEALRKEAQRRGEGWIVEALWPIHNLLRELPDDPLGE